MGELIMYSFGKGTNIAGTFRISDPKKMKVNGAGLVLKKKDSV